MKRYIAYFPIAAYLGYLFYGCFLCALAAGDVRLLKLGVVSLPAVAAMLAAAARLKRRGG